MRTQKIKFSEQEVLCFFPNDRSDLGQAISELSLEDGSPVIVLTGGGSDERETDVTRRAIQTIAGIADNLNAVVICEGTDSGVMAEIGQIRWKRGYTFSLVGIAPEELVTWVDGPSSKKFLWWGEKRWQLEPHYSNFILVPGSQFSDESPWVFDAATIVSKDHKSVTILINGGDVSRMDVELSLKIGRPVIALSRTGGLADEIARQPNRHELITVAPANTAQQIIKVVQEALTMTKSDIVIPSVFSAK